MSTHETAADGAESHRETYEEYTVGSVTVVMIADPQNEHAWIQSDVTYSVDP